jgi:hypothetical protein
MARPEKTHFIPKNPQKYMGTNVNDITARSSWEVAAMNLFDSHPDVVGWSSESIKIPYQNPFTQKFTVYIPDFLVRYRDRSNNLITELIEIKPKEQVPGYQGKVSKLTESHQVINSCKWAAARVVCNKNGWRFRLMSEDDMFKVRRSKGK